MKAISILQPWASLCVHTYENGKALKQIETRSWNTKYRGELLIHASMGKKGLKLLQDNLDYNLNWHIAKTLGVNSVGQINFQFALGAIIGKVELVETFEMNNIVKGQNPLSNCTNWIELEGGMFGISDQELAFGDYSANRFGWLLSDPVLFDEPIPCKGQLGLWNFDLDLYHHPQYKYFR